VIFGRAALLSLPYQTSEDGITRFCPTGTVRHGRRVIFWVFFVAIESMSLATKPNGICINSVRKTSRKLVRGLSTTLVKRGKKKRYRGEQTYRRFTCRKIRTGFFPKNFGGGACAVLSIAITEISERLGDFKLRSKDGRAPQIPARH
jgi:hypothetical protein